MSASSSPAELEPASPEEASPGSSESGEIARRESEMLAPEEVRMYGTVDLAGLMRSMYDSLRTWYEIYVVDAKPGEPKLIPSVYILHFPRLFEKSWGYDRLYPKALDEWCSYHAYLKKFYLRNCVPGDDLNAYELCLEKELELREWLTNKINVIVTQDEINLSNNISSCISKLMLSKADQNVTATNAAKCIAKEAELIIERLRRSPNVLDPEQHPNQSTQIRELAYSYMSKDEQGCESGSDIAHLVVNVAMVGITKEAELMCAHLERGHAKSYEIYLNREIRCFAIKLATENLSNLIETAVMAQRWQTCGENKLKLAAYIENDAQLNPRRYDGDLDCDEPDRSSEKALGDENSQKEQLEEGMGCHLLSQGDNENTQK